MVGKNTMKHHYLQKKIFTKNYVFGKTMQKVRKHRDIELFTTEKRRSYLVSGSSYDTTKFFTENQLPTDR